MTDPNTQAVATEAEAQVTPAAEATSAQNTTPDLDSLLSEFETQAKPQPAPAPASTTAADPEIAELKRKVASMEFKQEFEPILKRVRGELSPEVLSDEELTDLLDGRAKRDPRVQNAYMNRHANPSAWAKIEKALNAELSKKFTPRVDAAATEDRAAVAAAVRGTSNKAPEEKTPDYGSMPNSDFQRELAKHGIY